jgi:uncharacterized membrane protein YjjP (DUF1212 family)
MRLRDFDGKVADDMEARVAIVRRIESKEITLEQGQAEIRKLKREAKKRGEPTLFQVYRRDR